MNTQQLETFVEVAEHLNFARAAEHLNITTSAVSRQIRSLEEELDTKLFRRSTKSVHLTPAGIIFLNDAKEILSKLELTTQKIKTHSDKCTSSIYRLLQRNRFFFVVQTTFRMQRTIPRNSPLPPYCFLSASFKYAYSR